MNETMFQKCKRLFKEVEVNIDPKASVLKKDDNFNGFCY